MPAHAQRRPTTSARRPPSCLYARTRSASPRRPPMHARVTTQATHARPRHLRRAPSRARARLQPRRPALANPCTHAAVSGAIGTTDRILGPSPHTSGHTAYCTLAPLPCTPASPATHARTRRLRSPGDQPHQDRVPPPCASPRHAIYSGSGRGWHPVLAQSEDQNRPHPAPASVHLMSTQVRSSSLDRAKGAPRSDPQIATRGGAGAAYDR